MSYGKQKDAAIGMELDDEVSSVFGHFVSEIKIDVEDKLSGMRLDRFLALKYPEISRSLITVSIRNKSLLVDGSPRKSSYRLKPGDQVSGCIAVPGEINIHPERIDLQILYEDAYLLLLSKPPGLVVHPGCGNPGGTLVNGLLYHCKNIEGVGENIRPGIVHRLDKDTSGIMVVAKTDLVHKEMVDIFKEHRLEKEYLALICGVPQEKSGRIVTSIGRHPVRRQKMAVRVNNGKHAVTNWEVVETCKNYSLLKINIETGRTHQIRVHMAHLGFPVAGDTLYGRTKRDSPSFPRQMLHAWRLAFTHPGSGKCIDLKAELWPDFRDVLINMGFKRCSDLL